MLHPLELILVPPVDSNLRPTAPEAVAMQVSYPNRKTLMRKRLFVLGLLSAALAAFHVFEKNVNDTLWDLWQESGSGRRFMRFVVRGHA